MSIPRYALSFTKGRHKRFRFQVTRAGVVEDLTNWPNLWFGMKYRYADADADLVFEYVLFAGVEVIDAEDGIAEVLMDPADAPDLDLTTRESFEGDVGGIDGDLERHQLMTLAITGYPVVRQSFF